MGWTLNLEVYFYIIFALTLLGKKTYAPTITTVIITIFWMVGFFTNGLGIGHLEFYSSGYIPYFSAGIATYCAWRKLKDVAKKILQVLSLLLISLYIAAQAVVPLYIPLHLLPLFLASCSCTASAKESSTHYCY